MEDDDRPPPSAPPINEYLAFNQNLIMHPHLMNQNGFPNGQIQRQTSNRSSNPASPDSPAINESSMPIDTARTLVQRKLQNRTNRADLIDKHVLPPDTLPGEHFRTVEKLERRQKSDSLNHKIKARPTKDSLIKACIIHDHEQRKTVAQELERKLQDRPGAMDVLDKGYFFNATQTKQPKKFVFHKMKWENGKMVKETEPKATRGVGNAIF